MGAGAAPRPSATLGAEFPTSMWAKEPPRSPMIVLLFIVVAVAATPRMVVAQDSRAYAGGSFMISWQGSVRPGESPSFPRSGVGGTAAGGIGEIGSFRAPALGISVEVSVPLRLESIQETYYVQVVRTDNRHRDFILSGLFHVRALSAGAISAALVGGPSVVREDTLQRTALQIGSPGLITRNFGPFGPETQLTRWTVGVTGGVDVGARVTGRIEIVPQLRLHWIQRAESGSGYSGFLGLGSLVVRPAVGIRASF